jgi:hypothetical protein
MKPHLKLHPKSLLRAKKLHRPPKKSLPKLSLPWHPRRPSPPPSPWSRCAATTVPGCARPSLHL